MKFYIFTFLSLLFFSCSEKVITGVYHRQYETVTLKEDSTYDYKYRIEQPKFVSTGIWSQLGKNKIHLKSRFNLDSVSIDVEEARYKEEGVKILIEAQDSLDFSYVKDNLECTYIINGKATDKRKLGAFSTDISQVKSIKIIFHYKYTDFRPFEPIYRDQFQTETYFVKDKNSNLFKIKVPLSYIMFYSVTINDIVEFKGNKLFWPKKDYPPFKKIK